MKTSNTLASITEAIDDIRAGKMLIVIDDEDRENEGDLVVAGEKITPEIITFMATKARGLICAPCDASIAKKLHLLPMVAEMDDNLCPFTVSLDAREGISTGISSADRSHTIHLLTQKDITPHDFVRPGHIFPLKAKTGGVLQRAGHTEASLDFCRLAGLSPVAAICEIMNDDGTMARLPDLQIFAKKHDLKIVSIADLISYRQQEEVLVEKVGESKVETVHGDFRLMIFREKLSGQEHAAFVTPHLGKNPLVRVQSECPLGDLLPNAHCHCREDIAESFSLLAKSTNGVFLSMRSGKEDLLSGMTRSLASGAEDIHENMGHTELRNYGIGAQILRLLGISEMKLLTQSTRKIVGLDAYGLSVTERISLPKRK